MCFADPHHRVEGRQKFSGAGDLGQFGWFSTILKPRSKRAQLWVVAYETRLIERYRSRYGADTLPGNLTNR